MFNLDLFDISKCGREALEDLYPSARPASPLDTVEFRNPLANIAQYLSPADAGNLFGLSNVLNDRATEYWAEVREVCRMPLDTPVAAVKARYRYIFSIVTRHSDRIREEHVVQDFVRRVFSLRQNKLCIPSVEAPSVVYSAYLKQCDNSLFIFANKIAAALGRPAFPTVDRARAYLNDPNNQAQLQGITQLTLRSSDLDILPAEIGLLTSLQTLVITGCSLTSLPAEIGQLTALRELYVSDNQLTSLPAEIGQLTALGWLNVRFNQLTSLPVEIGQLTALRRIDIWGNKLTSLPVEIGQLTALQFLEIRNNQLTSLPAEIGQLAALERLDVRFNQLTSLPAEIGQLTALQWLDVSWNQLTSLPLEMRNLSSNCLSLYWRAWLAARRII